MMREIFVIDDNSDFQFIFFKLFKELNTPYSVKFFTNPQACHRYMKELKSINEAKMPALVVLDLKMPGMTGLQLLQMLRSPVSAGACCAHNIPVVIMSNEISENQTFKCYQAGANAVILKPMDFTDMKITIQSICRFWLDRDENIAISNRHIQ